MTRALSFVMCVLAAATGLAQERSVLPRAAAQPGVTETAHLTVTIAAAPVPVPAGGRVTLQVEVVPKPTMHVYAPEETRYIPVSLRLEPTPRITAAAAVFPKAESFYFAPLEETQLVFSRAFRIAQPLTVRGSGRLELRGTLRYQACDDRVCYLPREVPLRWTLAPQ